MTVNFAFLIFFINLIPFIKNVQSMSSCLLQCTSV